MLFNKKIEPSCSYCRFGSRISETEVACLKRGIVSSGGECGKFTYDPLRRDPPVGALLDKTRYSEEDFTL